MNLILGPSCVHSVRFRVMNASCLYVWSLLYALCPLWCFRVALLPLKIRVFHCFREKFASQVFNSFHLVGGARGVFGPQRISDPRTVFRTKLPRVT